MARTTLPWTARQQTGNRQKPTRTRRERMFRAITVFTLACLGHLAVNGPLWAQVIDQERQQRTMMREAYESLLGPKDPEKESVEGVQRSLERLLKKLAHAQATPVESRFTPGNYAPAWAAITNLRKSIEKTVQKLEKQRQRLERGGFDREVLDRHDQAVATATGRLAAPLAVIDELERALELARFDQVETLVQALRQAILDQEPGSRAAAERTASHSAVTPRSDDSRTSYKLAPPSPNAQDLELTPETAVTSEMAALASDLDHDPARLYAWVRNTVDLVPTYGLVQGAGETLASGRGNPVDQAALLIGLLRTSGVPARFVHGTVEIPATKLAAWLGTADAGAAVELLSRNGVATQVQNSGGEIGSVRLTHTWVRAWVRYGPHRGLKAGAGDRWADLDPSYKAVTVRTQKDVATEIGVDPVNFLRQIKSQSTIDDAESWVTQLPEDFIVHSIDLWGGDVERYAAANGLTTENLYGSRSVVAEDLKILPLSLPYSVVSELGSGPSPASGLETAVELRLTDSLGAALLAHATTFHALAGHRVTLRFSPESQADQDVLEAFRDEPEFPVYLVSVVPSLLLDGVEVVTGSPVGMGETLDLEMTLDGPLFENERSHSPVVAGAYAALSFDLQGITRRNLYQHLGPLRQAAEDLAAGSTSEVDAVLGEALHTIGLSYWHQLDGLNELAGGGLGVVVSRQPSQLVAAYEPVVTKLLGVPFEATGSRTTLAVGGDRITALSTTSSADTERQLHLVSTLTGSVLQHSILEQTLGGEGISTIRLLQAASRAGTPVYTFDGGNVGEAETALGALDPALTATIRNTVLAGYQVTVAAEPATYGGFQGVGWSAFDPVTGNANVYIDRSQAAGMRLSDALAPADLMLGAEPTAYLPLVAPGVQWIELAASIIEQSGLRYVPAVASIGQWFADSYELDNAAFLAAGIALSGPISLIASRPTIGQVTVTPEVFSPNGDGIKDSVTIRAGLSRESLWQVQIVDESQVVVAGFSGQGQGIDLSWDGASAGEGRYTVKIDATAVGLDTPAFPEERALILDVTPPTTGILTPAAGDVLQGVVSIVGTADDANFASYTLEAGAGTSPATWTPIGNGTAVIIDSSLGLWNGTAHPNGPYTLRLQAEDRGGNRSSFLRQVILDDPGNDLEAPVVTLELPADGAVVDGLFTLRAEASDNQGVHRVTLEVDGKPAAHFYEASPENLYEVTLDSVTLSNGAHVVTATAVDARGNQGSDQREISTANPVAGFSASPNPFSPNGDGIDDTTSLTATLEPADDWTLKIRKGTNPDVEPLRSFSGTGGSVLRSWDGRDAAGQMQDTGEYTATLSTTGGASASITIALERTNTPPYLEITSPQHEQRIYTEIEVLGTVTDSDLVNWTLEYRRLNDEERAPIAAGSHRVVAGVLGRFDATRLKNDPYELILTGFDSTGQGMELTRRVYVEGVLKIGNQRFTQQDMTVPIEGLPITVARTYDSLERHELGDFGYGWALSYNSVKLDDSTLYQEAEIVGGGSVMARAGGGRDVTVTLPDGRRTTFYFTLLPGGPFGKQAAWQAEPGVRYSLGVVGDSTEGAIITLPGIPPYWYHGTVEEGFDDYDLPGYVLSSDEGAQYYITKPLLAEQVPLAFPDGSSRNVSRVFGKPAVTRIVDRNGNHLQFTENGISHSNGLGVVIERDPVTHLITKVTDSEQREVRYTYDAEENLVAVTNPLDQTYRFTYDTDHNIKEIITPDGSKPIIYHYDDQGRIVGISDTNGDRMELTHVTSQRQEVMTDREGNPTIYAYNDRGLVVAETNALGQTQRYEHDHNGNLVKEIDPLGNVTQYSYDGNGNLTSTIDPMGHVVRNTYDGDSRLLTTTDANGHVTSYTYDQLGNVTSRTGPRGNSVQLTRNEGGLITNINTGGSSLVKLAYSPSGYVHQATDASGNLTELTHNDNGQILSRSRTRTLLDGQTESLETSYEYDVTGSQVKEIDPLGNYTETEYTNNRYILASIDKNHNRIEYEYDDHDRVSRITFPDQTTEEYTYDKEGRKLSVTDRRGNTTLYTYDALGRKVRETYPDNASRRWRYNSIDLITEVIDELGNSTQFEWDAAGRQTKMIDASGNVTRYTHDAAGNLIEEADPLGRTTKYEYDAGGNLTRVLYADGSARSSTYDTTGRKKSDTDATGNTTHYEYDAGNNLIKVIDPRGGETTYTYDEVGNLIGQQDAEGRTTEFEYDPLGRLIRQHLPLGQIESRAYDANGNLVTSTDYNGETVEYEYDVNNRLAHKSYSRAGLHDISYTYLPTGELKSVTDELGTTTYEYDDRYRLTGVINPDGKNISYEYDLAGNQVSVTTPEGTIQFAYTATRQLESVTDTAGRQTRYEYDAVGLMTGIEYANGISTALSYDPINRLEWQESTLSNGAVLSAYHYSRAPEDRRMQVTENGGRVVEYGFDELLRLAEEKVWEPGATDPSRIIEYTFDRVGNRLTKTENGVLTSYTYDLNDRLLQSTSDTEATDYSYDSNGNLVQRQDSEGITSFSWDQENQLIGVQSPSVSLQQRYNGLGVRVETSYNDGSAIRYLVDMSRGLHTRVLSEYDQEAGLLRSFCYGQKLISQTEANGTQRYFHFDGIGSVRQLTNENGALRESYLYDAYGNLVNGAGASDTTYLFQGERLDPLSGLYFLRARYYQPETGRFISQDLLMGRPRVPMSLHKYLYAFSNPIDFHDPLGLESRSQVGMQAHKALEDLYRADNSGHDPWIYTEHYISVTGWVDGRSGIIPDILDAFTGEVYEIKPLTSYGIATGYPQLLFYLDVLNGIRSVLRLMGKPLFKIFERPFVAGLSWTPGVQQLAVQSTKYIVYSLGNAGGVVFYKAFKSRNRNLRRQLERSLEKLRTLQYVTVLVPALLQSIAEMLLAYIVVKFILLPAISIVSNMVVLLGRIALATMRTLLAPA